MTKKKRPKNQRCSNGNLLVYRHRDKETRHASECHPRNECEKDPCPFAKVVER